MADQRRASIGHVAQRSLMGPPPPPETPSRLMQQPSPNLFPSLQFSPDIFANSPYGPATAPIYPQQRLFWDTNIGMEDPTAMHPYPDAFTVTQPDFSTSFGSTATIVPSYMPAGPMQQQNPYDLPPATNAMPVGYIDGSAFPAPFTTSPRAPPPREDNPSMFLSSPARRFGTDQRPSYPIAKHIRELPAYHHQIEESRREQEAKRSFHQTELRQPSITRSVMEALRRPVSPAKKERPGLKRSLTHSGVGTRGPSNRPQTHVSFLETASNASGTSNRSRSGRISPLKAMSNARQPSKRASVSLSIDENGVAKTIVTKLAEDDEMDIDDSDALSDISSRDGADFDALRSQPNSFYIEEDNYPTARVKAGIRPRPGSSAAFAGPGDAAQAVRAIIEDRTRSTSGHDGSSGSVNSAQFNSSPPVPQAHFSNFNASPTTITDPDLATPSTDRGSQASHNSTRCVCGTSPDDPGVMIQCDSCEKWLHAQCLRVDARRLPKDFICVFCIQTPLRGGRIRDPRRNSMNMNMNLINTSAAVVGSPLAHKGGHGGPATARGRGR